MTTPGNITKEWGLFGSVVSVVVCAVAGVAGWYLAPHSDFVRNSPTEYGGVMFAILSAGVIGTMTGYLVTLLELTSITKSNAAQERGVKFAAFLILIAGFFAGWSMLATWQRHDFTARFEYDDLFALYFALASATAVFIVSQCSKDNRWRLQFWIIEIPLLVSLTVVILGKLFVFSQMSDAYNRHILHLPYYPTGQPFGWEISAQQIRTDLRAAFWTGTSAGVVGVQLIIAQIAALCLEISQKQKT